ncbi:MAG: glycosyltransferase family 2 protein [Candidatus Brocadia sp.]|nr:glycosyltransferase family 2 protein [Candidatus Brocadia sp.]
MDDRSGQIKISAIVPTYNRAYMVSGTLRSLKRQSLPQYLYEIIVVDNYVSSNTRDVVEQINREGGKEILYVYEPHLGLHNARHRGARVSRGEILAYTDDDAICDVNWLSALLKEYQSDEIACVGGKILPKWETPPPAWMRLFEPWTLSLLDYGDERLELAWPQNPFGCNFSIRKDTLFKLGGFNPECVGNKWVGDGEAGLLRRLYGRKFKVVYAPDAVVWHIIHSEKASLSGMKLRLANCGAAHSCADYKINKYRPYKLLWRSCLFMMRYFKQYLSGIWNRFMKKDAFYLRECWKDYNKSRAIYELRLIFDNDLIRLVSREDWINEK